MSDKLRIVTVQHPKIAKILTEIHADNGGCTATEWEKCLEDFTNEELRLIAAGEETTEMRPLLDRMEANAVQLGYDKHRAKEMVHRFHRWLNAAFD
jgi:type II secretory pathway component PulF